MVRLRALLLLLLLAAACLPAWAQAGEAGGGARGFAAATPAPAKAVAPVPAASAGAGLPRHPFARETLFITAARVMPASGDPLLLGRIVVRDGKIAAVGTEIPRPAFSREIDASSLTITPGFVLPLTRLPLPPPPPPPPGEGLRIEVKLEAKGSDEARFRDQSLRALAEAGITTVGVPPLSREAGIPGFASALSTSGRTRAGGVLAEDAAIVVLAVTPEPWRKAVGDAVHAADAARRVREDRARRGEESEGDPGPLERALQRQKPVLLVAPTPALLVAASDVLPLRRLDASVLDGTDLWWERERVKALGLRVLCWPNLVRQRGTRFPINRSAEWAKAGVKVAFVLPEDTITGAQRLRDAACAMVRAGLPRDTALRALTSEAAAALGVADQVGSIQAGRRADLLFWTGDPFEPTSRLVRVMSGGELLQRAEEAELP